jgi:predicted TIM-barrel fold metal-dependent hydrolase
MAITDFIVDTDTHVSEPPDLWTSRLPKSLGDSILQVRWSDQAKAEMWFMGDRPIFKAWAGAMYGWPEPFPSAPPTQADAHPASYDANERLKAMDASGISVACLYPNVAGGAVSDPYSGETNPEVSLAHLRAYNDFLLDWITPAPERFVPLALIPYWDVPASVAEIERVAAMGHKGVVTTGAPHQHAAPYLADHHWDPIWAACQAAGLPVSFHVANGDLSAHLAPERLQLDGPAVTYARTSTGAFLDNGQQVTDLLLGGVLARFPDLKFVSVESGIGWIPFVLESCDYHFKKAGVWKEKPEFGDLLPSDLFRRQLYVNYWFERLEDWHVEVVGEDHILFETDFPHPTCLYGDEIPEAISNGLSAQPDRIQEKILWKNAAALYNLAGPAS